MGGGKAPGGCLRGEGEGLKYFFSGPKVQQSELFAKVNSVLLKHFKIPLSQKSARSERIWFSS